MAQVDLQQVTKVYPGGVRAVDGVSLSIADQEFVVLVGPSGCGKSTTLRMVAGLEEISGGTIRIGERVVNDVAPKDRDIAMVFQNYALYPHMSVYRNMEFGLKLRRVPRAQRRQRVIEAARILEIEHLLDRRPKALSGGQRQRVAVGRAIVREPSAFLFDEPLSNLDAKLRVTTRAELKRLHQRLRTTTIYVTHDQEEAMTLGDRIVVMKDGKIQQANGPLRTYNYPANRFVAGFIGMPPMNFFDGTIRAAQGQLAFEEGQLPRRRAGAPPGKTASELTLPGNGFTLDLAELHGAAPKLAAALQSRVGQHVVLGIRPEHLSLDPSGMTPKGIAVRIGVVEPLGNDMDVYVKTPLHDQVVARVAARSDLTLDSQATLSVAVGKVHFFDPGETGVNLNPDTATSDANASSAPRDLARPDNEPIHAIA